MRAPRGIRGGTQRSLVKAAIRQGWTVTRTGDDHLCVTSPAGGRFIVSMTADDKGRQPANARATARRAGLVL